jgi:nucleoside-diphosphate-sugar epimerase
VENIMNLQNKTLLITGIGDFIGLRTAEMALARGMQVRGLEASPEKAWWAESLGATVVVGDINDVSALQTACAGADIVFHTTSHAEAGGDLAVFRRVNVAGTITTAEVAKSAGVRTFVHLSSVMVYGFKFPDQITEEARLYSARNPFCLSKVESEQEIIKFNHPPQFGVIILRPGDIYGPGAQVWIVKPLQLMQKQSFVLINGGKGICNHVYVDNLVDAFFLALEKEAHGQILNITDGCRTTWKDYYHHLAGVSGQSKPELSMPALAVKTALQQMGKTLDLMPESIDFVTRTQTYSIEKAKRLLGYAPRIDLAEGMTRTGEWLASSGFLTG